MPPQMKSCGRHVRSGPDPIAPAPETPVTEPTRGAEPVTEAPLGLGESEGFESVPPDIDDKVD